MLRITWALGTDTSIGRYDGLISGVDTTEINRFGGFALELTGQGFDPMLQSERPRSWGVRLFRVLRRGSRGLRRQRW